MSRINNGNIWEPSAELDALVRRVIGAVIEVHKELGPGLPEEAYQRALEIEFTARNIPYVPQHPVTISYKGIEVCKGRVDFLVAGELVIEIKSVDSLGPIHHKQILAYLHQLKLHLGLLVNFNVPLARDGIRRVIRS